MADEISIEKVLDMLELPFETLAKLSRANTPEDQSLEMAQLRAVVLMQRRKLFEKYRVLDGTATWENEKRLINQAVNIFMSLQILKPGETGRLTI